MSHTVTVTRTTTTTSTSAILLNVGYFKTVPGILKLLHVILGVICVGIVGNYISFHKYSYAKVLPDHLLFVPELFFLLIVTTCMIASALLLLSCLISIATATILPKTVFEVVYHLTAAVLLLIASIVYIVDLNRVYPSYYKTNAFNFRLAAGVLGLVNSILYGVATFFAYRNFKSG